RQTVAVDDRVRIGDRLAYLSILPRNHRLDLGIRDQFLECRAFEVDDEVYAVIRALAIGVPATRLGDPRLRRAHGIIHLPGQAVIESEHLTGRRQRFGHPVRNDVVVGFIGARDLHQLDAPGAPLPDRLHPYARTLVEARLEVLVVREAPIALLHPESERIDESERRYQ